MTGATSGFTIRRASLDDARLIASVHVQSWQTSYLGIMPKDFLSSLSIERRMQGWACRLSEPQHATFVGAMPDGRVVGFCDAGTNRDEPKAFRGEVYAIYLLEEVQRKGLGRALFNEATAWLKENDLSPFLVWVLTDNRPARSFYEALGGQRLDEKPIAIGGVALAEVAYGWREN